MSSIASNTPNPAWTSWQASLLQSCVRGDEPRVRALLHDDPFSSTTSQTTSRTTAPATTNAPKIPPVHLLSAGEKFKAIALRQALQKVAGRGHERLTQFLLEQGAEVNPPQPVLLTTTTSHERRGSFGSPARTQAPAPAPAPTGSGTPGEAPALYKAAELNKENFDVVRLLLDHGADTEGREPKTGRTAIFPVAQKGLCQTLRCLLDAGANVNAKDASGQNILLCLASEKGEGKVGKGKWGSEIVKVLLAREELDLEARDKDGRTALLWAAATGKEELATLLLTGRGPAKGAEIQATNFRTKTALHLAAENHRVGMVKVLLEHGAQTNAWSDGGWFALHNAAEKGHEDIAALLLQYGADVNATTSSGMTALHWCARNGHLPVVELLLQQKGVKRNSKDSFDSTPMLGAAQNGHLEIVERLSPADDGRLLSQSAEGACKGFQATVVDFGMEHRPINHTKHSVFDLLYGWDEKREKPLVTTLVRNIPAKPTFRWIHLPTNNMTWVEALMTKHFVENQARDVEGFKVLEKSFGQLHRGPTVHSHFMRPLCQRMPPTERNPPLTDVHENAPEKVVNEIPKIVTTKPEESPAREKGTPEKASKRAGRKGEKSEKPQERVADSNASKKAAKILRAEANGTPTKKGGSKQLERSKTPTGKTNRQKERAGNIVLFMPYLHYETHPKRKEMSDVIQSTKVNAHYSSLGRSCDEMLIQAYLHSTHNLQIRRTLDQFYYHAISTDDRDEDQVVYRYTKDKTKHPDEVKVFMVDQLWMWILGGDLIVTSFPQRWKQPKNDPLNVLDGIIEDMSSKTRPPVRSIYDLATLITGRCSGVFDRHRVGDEDYQFLDMFESSIGEVTNKETELFKKFNNASIAAAAWLRTRQRGRTSQPELSDPPTSTIDPNDDPLHNPNPSFIDTLLDIGAETGLLAETKDIRDELNMITMVLKHQTSILDDMMTALLSEVSGKAHQHRQSEIKRRFQELHKVVEVHLKDVERMDRQAESIYTSLTHLLDLKQKHANAFEARFARDQAAFTGRQGQTIMVFTIVTVVFLPMSFIAAFFAIPISNFLKDDGDGGATLALGLGYVSKFVFGVGLAISIPLIAVAFAVDNLGVWVKGLLGSVGRRFERGQRGQGAKGGYSGRRLRRSDVDESEGSDGGSVNEKPEERRPRPSMGQRVENGKLNPGWREKDEGVWRGSGSRDLERGVGVR